MTDIQSLLWEIQGRLTACERDLFALKETVAKLRETGSIRAKGRSTPDWERIAEKLSTKLLTFGILLASGGMTVIEALKVAFK